MIFADFKPGDRFEDAEQHYYLKVEEIGERPGINAVSFDGSVHLFCDEDPAYPISGTLITQSAEIPMARLSEFLDILMHAGYQCLCTLNEDSKTVVVEYLPRRAFGPCFRESPN